MQYVESHGARIPSIGLGTWQLSGDTCVTIVREALKLGYRHVDTAQAYGNEAEVGEGIRASGIKREDVFLTTKVAHPRFGDLEKSVDESIAKLKFPYVDLLLLHWPNPAFPIAETLKALARVKKAGLTRHIGISNFTVAMVDEAVKLCSEPIVNNQVEIHPFLDASKVIAECRRHGMSVTAYCPIARGKAPGNAVLEKVGKAHGKTAAQVSLRYLVQRDLIVVPRTSKVERLKENFAIFDFKLSDAEMAEVAALSRDDGRVVTVGWAPKWD